LLKSYIDKRIDKHIVSLNEQGKLFQKKHIENIEMMKKDMDSFQKNHLSRLTHIQDTLVSTTDANQQMQMDEIRKQTEAFNRIADILSQLIKA
jgi:uncharacterized protein YaiI (UPF0178 family)